MFARSASIKFVTSQSWVTLKIIQRFGKHSVSNLSKVKAMYVSVIEYLLLGTQDGAAVSFGKTPAAFVFVGPLFYVCDCQGG